MAAPKGNNFHELRNKKGRGKIYDNPDDLWNDAVDYFDWCDDNPWMKNEQLKKPTIVIDDDGNEQLVTICQIPTARPYTLSGLCLFLNIDEVTFNNYCGKEGYEVFFNVCTRIKLAIYNQKYEGAAVGAFNPSIIARDLGLADKKELSGEVGMPVIQIISPNASDKV